MNVSSQKCLMLGHLLRVNRVVIHVEGQGINRKISVSSPSEISQDLQNRFSSTGAISYRFSIKNLFTPLYTKANIFFPTKNCKRSSSENRKSVSEIIEGDSTFSFLSADQHQARIAEKRNLTRKALRRTNERTNCFRIPSTRRRR